MKNLFVSGLWYGLVISILGNSTSLQAAGGLIRSALETAVMFPTMAVMVPLKFYSDAFDKTFDSLGPKKESPPTEAPAPKAPVNPPPTAPPSEPGIAQTRKEAPPPPQSVPVQIRLNIHNKQHSPSVDPSAQQRTSAAPEQSDSEPPPCIKAFLKQHALRLVSISAFALGAVMNYRLMSIRLALTDTSAWGHWHPFASLSKLQQAKRSSLMKKLIKAAQIRYGNTNTTAVIDQLLTDTQQEQAQIDTYKRLSTIASYWPFKWFCWVDHALREQLGEQRARVCFLHDTVVSWSKEQQEELS